ncbi:MAG: zinc ribbon domain-containing protein [Deltaproteobacteria bacterium]|nr:zinc ribbon domain-containing protein [Deltaproteobacteria bacterium]
MPIYEFYCKECNKSFETLIMGGKNDVHCPTCGGENVTRQLSGFASRRTGKGGGSSCSGCTSSSCNSCR